VAALDLLEMAWLGCLDWLCQAWLALARLGLIWFHIASLLKVFEPRFIIGLTLFGLACHGLTWLGLAWLGLAWPGLTCLDHTLFGLAKLGLFWLGSVSIALFLFYYVECCEGYWTRRWSLSWLGLALAWLGLP
jgi:hypothetical protein